jgi:hypothetical protein
MQVESRKKWPDSPQPATDLLECYWVHIVTYRDLLELVVLHGIDNLRHQAVSATRTDDSGQTVKTPA